SGVDPQVQRPRTSKSSYHPVFLQFHKLILLTMGQYFQLINLDKRQTFGHWGKLQELFGYRPLSVIPYLVVPASAVPTSVPNADLIGSWAGDRIICIGDYINKNDYPEGLLTQEETLEIQDTSLYSVVYKKYETVQPIQLPATEAVAFGHDRVWILRNLSKHKYIRISALGADPQDVVGPETRRGPTFGDALLPWITWTSDTGFKFYSGDIGRGAWAGDRFDIQMIDTVEGDEDWMDVSDKFAGEIASNRRLYRR
ncbi:hypothetical protein Hypma_006270, partial [Hypsizygus marmoreus]